MKHNFFSRPRKFRLDKLVRDKIPLILRSQGITVFDHTLDTKAWSQSLKNKLLEEANEVQQAQTAQAVLEELADVLETIIAVGQAYNLSFDAIETARIQKREEKGGFENRIYIHGIEMASNHPQLGYYLARPEDYPEVPEVDLTSRNL